MAGAASLEALLPGGRPSTPWSPCGLPSVTCNSLKAEQAVYIVGAKDLCASELNFREAAGAEVWGLSRVLGCVPVSLWPYAQGSSSRGPVPCCAFSRNHAEQFTVTVPELRRHAAGVWGTENVLSSSK